MQLLPEMFAKDLALSYLVISSKLSFETRRYLTIGSQSLMI